ncbi:RluA family pseudouridine synthase [Treponema sp.]|uniref:RluA family pseudouridine synthase n=1 Tax=Treponema sp. TaxID=166 RepID=UPI00298D8C5C|nr:RluA family pseudouridine synthase [Treponema sp.]MCR5613271.1 RluA family pseudouridine synthase [Treponema sp.]
MNFKEFTAGTDDNSRRLDKVIRKLIPEGGLSSLYSALRKGLIKVNDKKADASQKIMAGDKIKVAEFLINSSLNTGSTSDSATTGTPQIQFETIFNNEHLRIINKPYNVNVHGENSLANKIEELYKTENHEASLSFKPGPLHRLDKKTTGLLAFSNSLLGATWFTKAIEEKRIRKFYVGICQGRVESEQTWQDFIEEDKNKAGSFYTMKISSKVAASDDRSGTTGDACDASNGAKCDKVASAGGTDNAGKAITICTPLAHGTFRAKPVTLCQFEILTGKKHQIRCQSSHHGHPLLGDTAYNSKKINAGQDFFLHAAKLIFPNNNPLNLPESLTAKIPPEFTKFLNLSLIKWDGSLIIK